MKDRINRLAQLLKTAPPKRLLAIAGLLIVAAAIPFTVAVQQLQQEIRSRASTPVVTNALYVSPTGNDSNTGTKDFPFATINKAAAMAIPGTKNIVFVAPGTYNETVITNISGTETSRVKFISETKWGAKITSPGTPDSTDATWENNGNYVDISGFDISGGKRIGIINRASHVKISGNKVHDVAVGYCQNLGGAGIDSAYSAGQQNNEYDGNLVVKIGPKPCSYVHGIYIQSLNEKVTNNIIVNNGGIGIACTHGCNGPTIANNTIVDNGYGIRIGWSQDTTGKTNNAIVSNNIIYGHQGYTLYQYTTGLGTNNQFLNNLFFNNKNNACTASGTPIIECKNTFTTNPQFVNYQTDGSGDYHLKPNLSIAIDKGTNIGAPSIDYDNNPRPQGNSFDIGAYEYSASVTLTPTPVPCIPKPPECGTKMPNGSIIICDPAPGTTYCPPTPTPTSCSVLNETCGGIAGTNYCCGGLTCKISENFPDASGVCVSTPPPTPTPKPTPTPTPPNGCRYECLSPCPPGVVCTQVCVTKLVCPTTTPTPTPKPTPPSDINRDGVINNTDYVILVSCSIYSKDGGAACNKNPAYRTNSDLNGDKKINLDDLNIFYRDRYRR